jgi:hypothetical protein
MTEDAAKRLRAQLRAEFLDLLGGYLRFAAVAAFPPLIVWCVLPRFGLSGDECLLATTAVAVLMALLIIYSFIRIWRSNSASIRSKYGDIPKT